MRMITTLLALGLAVTPANADYSVYFGETWRVSVPDNCVIEEKASRVACKDGENTVIFIFWDPKVSEGESYTQQNQAAVADDAERRKKSVQAMKQRLVEYAKEHKDTISGEPEADVRLIGEGVVATVGAATTDEGTYISKVQIWNNGVAGEITGVSFRPQYHSVWWGIVGSIRVKYLGER